MKTFFQLIMAGLLIALLGSCSLSRQPGTSAEREPRPADIYEPDNTLTLADHLRRVAGVQVQGNGPNATITIRGRTSIYGSNEPLFVINGQPISGGFQEASQMVPVQEIKAIRVLKNPDEVGIYGVRGANGVIEIDMKKN